MSTRTPRSDTKEPKPPKRLNRAVGIAEAMAGTLDAALKKRGFASRDIVAQWQVIAPPPFNRLALPDKLQWPRGDRSAEGATLYLRAAPGQGLAIAHEGPAIAAAVNRYFGYVLVGQVRLSPSPFVPALQPKAPAADLTEADRKQVAEAVDTVADGELKEALRRLGLGIIGRTRQDSRSE